MSTKTIDLKEACYKLMLKVDDGQQFAGQFGMKEVAQYFVDVYDLYEFHFRDERAEIEDDEFLKLVKSMDITMRLLVIVNAKKN